MSGSPIAGAVRAWVDLYTRGMPPDARATRRDQIDDDLWCEHKEAVAAGRSMRSLDADLAMRLVLGMPADLSWRLTYRNSMPAANLERSASMGIRFLGLLAITAPSSLMALVILTSAFGEDAYTWGGTLVLQTGSMIAFMAAALGLAFQFQERVGRLGAAGAILVTLGSTMIIGGNATGILALAVGSAMLMLDLARIGVLSRRASIAHAAAAVLFGIGIAVVADSQMYALFLVGFGIYLLSWGAIGVSLLRGVPREPATSG